MIHIRTTVGHTFVVHESQVARIQNRDDGRYSVYLLGGQPFIAEEEPTRPVVIEAPPGRFELWPHGREHSSTREQQRKDWVPILAWSVGVGAITGRTIWIEPVTGEQDISTKSDRRRHLLVDTVSKKTCARGQGHFWTALAGI